MQILHVNKYYPPWIGGVETIVAEIAELLQGETCDNTVLVCQPPQTPPQTEHVNGVKVIRTKTWGTFLGMPLSFDFLRTFKQQARTADLVLLHHPFPLGFLAAFLFAKKKRLVIFYHADIVRQQFSAKLLAPLFHCVLSRASDILVTSDRLPAESALLRPYQSKCQTIPLWIQESDFALTPSVQEASKNITQTFGQPLILSVGRLVSYKGFLYLIEAMKHVSAHLLIIGTGPLKKELTEQIQKNHLENRITIMDPVTNLAPYYYAATVFVLPSITRAEAFGIVQLEAMFCGCPVLNTSLPTGVPEVSIDGQTGMTVEPKNAEALANALNRLLSDPVQREQFSHAAHERVVNHFSKQHANDKIKQILFRQLN